jgi:L-ascorbate metabolism protein UlaG (beta-lactamase superfamily)
MKTSSRSLELIVRHSCPVLALALAACAFVGQGQAAPADNLAAKDGDITVQPINHATLALQWNGQTVYVDPVGGAKAFAGLPAPDLIVITHLHGDHFSAPTLTAVVVAKTRLAAPASVAEQMPAKLREQTTVLTNGQTFEQGGVKVEAVPAYNLTANRLNFHPKGRDNGYVLTLGGKRLYFSGDTEDIPEMRALKNIDVAFVCMNLPYTMDVDHAASAVRAFKPAIVYPYHYRGADLERFKKLVGTDAGVEVRLRDWYGGGR